MAKSPNSNQKRSIFWGSRCTAPAIGKATFGSDCVQRSHDGGVHLCVYGIRSGHPVAISNFTHAPPKKAVQAVLLK
jgi:hypothetical protein